MLHFFCQCSTSSQCSSSSSLSAELLLLGLNFFTLLFSSVFDFFFYCLTFSLSAQFLLSVLNLFSQCPASSSLYDRLLLSVLNFFFHCSTSSLSVEVLFSLLKCQFGHPRLPTTLSLATRNTLLSFFCVFSFPLPLHIPIYSPLPLIILPLTVCLFRWLLNCT